MAPVTAFDNTDDEPRGPGTADPLGISPLSLVKRAPAKADDPLGIYPLRVLKQEAALRKPKPIALSAKKIVLPQGYTLDTPATQGKTFTAKAATPTPAAAATTASTPPPASSPLEWLSQAGTSVLHGVGLPTPSEAARKLGEHPVKEGLSYIPLIGGPQRIVEGAKALWSEAQRVKGEEDEATKALNTPGIPAPQRAAAFASHELSALPFVGRLKDEALDAAIKAGAEPVTPTEDITDPKKYLKNLKIVATSPVVLGTTAAAAAQAGLAAVDGYRALSDAYAHKASSMQPEVLDPQQRALPASAEPPTIEGRVAPPAVPPSGAPRAALPAPTEGLSPAEQQVEQGILDRIKEHPETEAQVRSDLQEVPPENRQAVLDAINREGVEAYQRGDKKAAERAVQHAWILKGIMQAEARAARAAAAAVAPAAEAAPAVAPPAAPIVSSDPRLARRTTEPATEEPQGTLFATPETGVTPEVSPAPTRRRAPVATAEPEPAQGALFTTPEAESAITPVTPEAAPAEEPGATTPVAAPETPAAAPGYVGDVAEKIGKRKRAAKPVVVAPPVVAPQAEVEWNKEDKAWEATAPEGYVDANGESARIAAHGAGKEFKTKAQARKAITQWQAGLMPVEQFRAQTPVAPAAAPAVPTTEQRMKREARGYADQFEEGHPARVPVESLMWQDEPGFDLHKIAGFDDGEYKQWATIERGDPDYVRDLEDAIKNDTVEPIIVVQGRDGKFYVWDGNQRVGMASILGKGTIPTWVGYQKGKAAPAPPAAPVAAPTTSEAAPGAAKPGAPAPAPAASPAAGPVTVERTSGASWQVPGTNYTIRYINDNFDIYKGGDHVDTGPLPELKDAKAEIQKRMAAEVPAPVEAAAPVKPPAKKRVSVKAAEKSIAEARARDREENVALTTAEGSNRHNVPVIAVSDDGIVLLDRLMGLPNAGLSNGIAIRGDKADQVIDDLRQLAMDDPEGHQGLTALADLMESHRTPNGNVVIHRQIMSDPKINRVVLEELFHDWQYRHVIPAKKVMAMNGGMLMSPSATVWDTVIKNLLKYYKYNYTAATLEAPAWVASGEYAHLIGVSDADEAAALAVKLLADHFEVAHRVIGSGAIEVLPPIDKALEGRVHDEIKSRSLGQPREDVSGGDRGRVDPQQPAAPGLPEKLPRGAGSKRRGKAPETELAQSRQPVPLPELQAEAKERDPIPEPDIPESARRPIKTFVSPNVFNLESLKEAQMRLGSMPQKLMQQESEWLLKELGSQVKARGATGIWEDGAENALMHEFPADTEPDLVTYHNAILAKAGWQKAMLNFFPHGEGNDYLYRLRLPKEAGTAAEITKVLAQHGLEASTILNERDGHAVMIATTGEAEKNTKRAIQNAVVQLGGKSGTAGAELRHVRGRSEYVGEDDRDRAGELFGRIIEDKEKLHPEWREIRRRLESRPGFVDLQRLVRETKEPFTRVTHGSKQPELVKVQPQFSGQGGPQRGEEIQRRKLYNRWWVDRSYFQIEGTPGEPIYQNLSNQYKAIFNAENLYNYYRDPSDLRDQIPDEVKRIGPGAETTYFEKLIKDNGYDGYYADEAHYQGIYNPKHGMVVAFYDTPVEKALNAGEIKLPPTEGFTKSGHWAGAGNAASGVLLVSQKTGRIGLPMRSHRVSSPSTWGTVGGAVEEGQTPEESARREVAEETGYTGPMEMIPAHVFRDGDFKYHNFIGVVPDEFPYQPSPESAWETQRFQWHDPEELKQEMRKHPDAYHPGLRELFDKSGSLIDQHAGGEDEDIDSLRSRQPDTPEFKRWFGDSKVVDEDGKPLAVYHGTTKDISEMESFDPEMAKSEGGAFFFSHTPTSANPALNANTYANKGAVVPVYLKVNRLYESGLPVPIPPDDSPPEEFDKWIDRVEKFNRGIDWDKNEYMEREIRKAKRLGFDGVAFRNIEDDRADFGYPVPTDVYAVFDPKQIKSAIGNRGTYDPDNPNILQSRQRKPESDPKKVRAEAEKLNPRGSTVPLLHGLLPRYRDMWRIGDHLESYTRQTLKQLSPGDTSAEHRAMVDRVVRIGRDELKYQLAQENSGVDWYKKDVRAPSNSLMSEMKKLHPELSDPTQEKMFLLFTAATSPGKTAAFDNVNIAEQVYDLYKRDKKVPLRQPDGKPWGTYGNAPLKTVQALLKHFKGDEAKAMEWMQTKHPIKELEDIKEKAGFSRDTVKNALPPDYDPEAVYGSYILGEKVGPFNLNLNGVSTELTVDIWFMRTWNRLMGTLVGPDPKGRKDFIVLDKPRGKNERAAMIASIDKLKEEFGLETSQVQAALWYYEQGLYNRLGKKGTYGGTYADAARDVYDLRSGGFTSQSEADAYRRYNALQGTTGGGAGPYPGGVRAENNEGEGEGSTGSLFGDTSFDFGELQSRQPESDPKRLMAEAARRNPARRRGQEPAGRNP
jgi:8-oxo-dGTP pyrophosphatase MutT (NUDIX family)